MTDLTKQAQLANVQYMKTFRVTKSNELIRNGKFDLNVVEQRIIFFLISKIEPDDDNFKKYEFDIGEFCSLCGIKKSGSYAYLKDVVKNLRDKSVWVETEKQEFTLSWLSSCIIDKETDKVTLEISDMMRPYLLQLKSNFTSYQLGDIIKFKCKYSTWFYDYMMCELGEHRSRSGTLKLSVEEIKEKNFCPNYSFGDLRKRVIAPALAEITKNTVINAEIEGFIKEKRSVKFVILSFSKKSEEEIEKKHQREFFDLKW